MHPLFIAQLAAGALLSTAQPDSVAQRTAPGPRDVAAAFTARSPAAYTKRPAASIEYSDWYGRRLTIHRWASYTTLPLFAFQYAAGSQLYEKGSSAPSWARDGHGTAAGALAVLFGANTVTGVWNLWDSRKAPEGRKWRTVHAVLMLASDAGFVATGMLAEDADDAGESEDDANLHRTVALTSIGVATVSYVMMLPFVRRD